MTFTVNNLYSKISVTYCHSNSELHLNIIELTLNFMMKLKPGLKVPVSGQYEVIGPRGGHTGQEITGVRGKVLPPTPTKNSTYILADKTK